MYNVNNVNIDYIDQLIVILDLKKRLVVCESELGKDSTGIKNTPMLKYVRAVDLPENAQNLSRALKVSCRDLTRAYIYIVRFSSRLQSLFQHFTLSTCPT